MKVGVIGAGTMGQGIAKAFAQVDGYEVALFPMPYLYMSQDEGGDYSHQGTYNIDILGWGPGGRIYQAPIYAPCTMKVVNYQTGYAYGNTVTYESINKVHLPNGNLDYLTISFAHDISPPVTTIGSIVIQGNLCYRTGTYGDVTGDHVHTCVGQGHYEGETQRPSGNYDLTNRIHYWDGVYINDTQVIQGFSHNWIAYNGPISTPVKKSAKQGFKWAIYTHKLRNNW